MKAKLLKQFRWQFHYWFKGDAIVLFDKRRFKEYIFYHKEKMELKTFIADWKWGNSGSTRAWDNERKREKNILKRKYKHLNLLN